MNAFSGSNTAQQCFDSSLEPLTSNGFYTSLTPEEHSISIQIDTCEKRDTDSGAEEKKNQSTFEASSDTKDY